MSVPGGGKAGERLVALDAYRGLVMLFMASAGLALGTVAENFPDDPVWQFLEFHTEHVPWRGWSLWDMIQPSFMFIVGVAMPFSYANRRAAGQGRPTLFRHALARSIILVLLGVFLSSAWSQRTNFAFMNVLTQIGLGYMVVFLLLDRPPSVQFGAALAILVGYWLAFALDPLAPPNSPHRLGGSDAAFGRLPGFLDHWSKHTNLAAGFDRWFLNLFPRPDGKPFVRNPEGYQTLNFVPSIATMLFGVLAGEFLRSPRGGWAKVQGLAVSGALGIVAGSLLDGTVCPIVKRIWTPSWAVYSAGWACWALAVLYAVVDVLGYRRWAFPLVVVGLNSIAMYLMAQLMKPFVRSTLRTHLGPEPFRGTYGPVVESAAVLLVLWLICLWMYRRRIFLRI
jgi:predicted acyltransferase